MKKILIQIYIDDELRDFIKEAARVNDRSLSSYIRTVMKTRAERDLGKEFKK